MPTSRTAWSRRRHKILPLLLLLHRRRESRDITGTATVTITTTTTTGITAVRNRNDRRLPLPQTVRKLPRSRQSQSCPPTGASRRARRSIATTSCATRSSSEGGRAKSRGGGVRYTKTRRSTSGPHFGVRAANHQPHEPFELTISVFFFAADAVSSLPRLSRTHPLPAPAEITTSTSFTELEAWETVARQHIELAKRAYDAWVFHREHFFAAGGDLVDRLEGRGEGPDGTDLARGAWEEVRLRGEKAEAVLKRKFPSSRH